MKIHTPLTFSLENYFVDCIVMAKIFIDLAKGTVAQILWQDAATDCVKPKTKITPFQVITQEKIGHWANITEDIAAGARPTKHISIKFEIWWKFKTL